MLEGIDSDRLKPTSSTLLKLYYVKGNKKQGSTFSLGNEKKKSQEKNSK